MSCSPLPGRAHFHVKERGEGLRLLVEGEELCRAGPRLVVNVAGMLVLAFVGPRSAVPAWSGAEPARLAFARRCAALDPEGAEGCIDALTAVAHCGAHTDCLRGRQWMSKQVGADDLAAWTDVLPAETAVAFAAGTGAESNGLGAPEDPLLSRPTFAGTRQHLARAFVGHAPISRWRGRAGRPHAVAAARLRAR